MAEDYTKIKKKQMYNVININSVKGSVIHFIEINTIFKPKKSND